MHGVLVTGGGAPENEIVLPSGKDRILVAADSGLDFIAARGWYPDLIVGDMDSVSDPELVQEFPDAEVELSPRDKDLTDTELGLEKLWERGVGKVTLIGAGGGRLDHLIGILRLFDRERYPQTWLTHREIVECIDRDVSFRTKPGEILSFFPVGSQTCAMRSRGLKWNLDNLVWGRSDVGISNESTAERCHLEVMNGRVLMVRMLPSQVIVLS